MKSKVVQRPQSDLRGRSRPRPQFDLRGRSRPRLQADLRGRDLKSELQGRLRPLEAVEGDGLRVILIYPLNNVLIYTRLVHEMKFENRIF